MIMDMLNRRTFLRLAAATTIGSAIAACDAGAQPPVVAQPTPLAAPTGTPAATATPVRIALAGGDPMCGPGSGRSLAGSWATAPMHT